MFFTGTLQEGISKALQESKLVVCFVTDEEEESTTWENEFLTDEAVAPLVEKDAVSLRLKAGSQEAGYLAAIFPLPKNPTLVVIKNGELKEYISAGTPKDEFVRRVSGAFHAQAAGATTTTAETPSSDSQTPGENTPASSSTPSSSEQQGQSSVAAATREAEVRRQAARKEREASEKRRREKEEDQQAQDPVRAKQNDAKKKAAQQLAERQRQAREDRARVLKRIEDDRAERKAREEKNRVAREMERRAAAGEDVEEITAAAGEPAPTGMSRIHDQCALQARLFDGSTIRTRLPAKATLSRDVRKWIDESRTDGSQPYLFKVILTPLPNRSIDPATEEEQTLEELGLTPNSTLVLAPVDRAVPAYPSINAGLYNLISHLIAAVLAFIGAILGSITGAVTGSGSAGDNGDSGAGQRTAPEQQDRSQGHTTGRDGTSASRIQRFQNPEDRKRDQQLYNGNSLNFEPRNDEEDKDQ
ncbi:hypothetical protein KVR01_003181 [Diaporthe batatas]|uniref:uncharacterized protein n=1 Tax=Diaporthe batatas TaxID=748121 RepID=UPI001D03CD1C|nr:uncharacterized protein KVR01_003181 [Diaporthe batatas]KAG8167492.1 hypothetical protein KVR01_003181 [Diaporthe batatas]